MQKSYQLFNNETRHEEYVKEEDVMNGLYIGKYSLPPLFDDELFELKEDLSKIDNKIPLYDVYTENLYLIERNKIFDAVFKDYYRFPTNKLINQLLEKQKENKKYLAKKKDVLVKRENEKITLIKKFMDNFNNNTLLKTYINALYDTDILGKSITLCRNPSFIPAFKHIRPYFTKKEQECAGLNNKIIDKDERNKELPDNKLRDICHFLSNYVLDADNLVRHHNYIIENNLTGIIQYYSMQGSYTLNEYLRNESIDTSTYFDNITKILSDAICNAPKFDKDIYIYRFIADDYVDNIKIGGTFSDKGFMSCSRNQFYKMNTKNDTFGWNLMKIKIPKEFSVLCIETVSQFPSEQEVILPPNTVLKLQSKNNKNIYYHPSKEVQEKINAIYEFIVVEEPKKYTINKKIMKEEIPIFNFDILSESKIKGKKLNTYSNRDTIIHFIINNTNSFNLFKSKIGDNYYTMIAEEYNSLSTYKPFYAKQTDNGFCIYSLDNKTNSFLFCLEITENKMYVNYNVKYDNDKMVKMITNDDFIDFLCRVSLYFNVQKIIYYCDYIYCNSIINDTKDSSSVNISSAYCNDIYSYLKKGIKKFKFIDSNFKPTPAFTYEMLDILKDVNVKDILFKKTNKQRDNKVYYIFHEEYMVNKNHKNNCRDFLIWLIENKCGYVDDFISCLSIIDEYKVFNPFFNDYYIFYPIEYMIESRIIKQNPYVNIYSREEIFDDINRFAGKRITRFKQSGEKYRRKNNLVLDDSYVSLLYLYK